MRLLECSQASQGACAKPSGRSPTPGTQHGACAVRPSRPAEWISSLSRLRAAGLRLTSLALGPSRASRCWRRQVPSGRRSHGWPFRCHGLHREHRSLPTRLIATSVPGSAERSMPGPALFGSKARWLGRSLPAYTLQNSFSLEVFT